MICNCFRRCAASALLLLAASLAGLPAQAAETLYPRFFWRAPPGETAEQSLVITAGAAYPDGGLAVAGFREGDPERYIYRIDPAGETMWELKIETGEGAVSVLVRDPRGGLVFCGGQNKVRRVDAQGHLDWVAADWRSPTGEHKFPYLHDYNDCDKLLADPDGSVLVAGTLLPSDDWVFSTARVTRIDSDGKTLWSVDRKVPGAVEGRIRSLIWLPGGDVEVVFDPLLPENREYAGSFRDRIFEEWRISPGGVWRPQNEMQRLVPPRSAWFAIFSLYRVGDRLVRVGEGGGEEDRLVFEQWTLDGSRRLATGFYPEDECNARRQAGSDWIERLAIPGDLDPDFFAAAGIEPPIAWYCIAGPAFPYTVYGLDERLPSIDAQLPHGRFIYLFGRSYEVPDEVYVVGLPGFER